MNQPTDEQSPLYQQVKRDLVAAISRGEYDPDQPFVSQREICERYGVSTTTAVKALNELVTEGLLVRKRGRGTFVAERPAGPAIRDRSIAYVMHGHGPHNSDVMIGIESVSTELGYRMYVSSSEGSAAVQDKALRQALDSGVSGVVLYPVGQSESPALAELRRQRVPIVMIDRYHPDTPTDAVLFDNFAVGHRLTEYLIDQGHERIATLWSETDTTSVHERATGHQQALLTRGLPIRPEFTALTSYLRQPDQQRRDMLTHLLDRPHPPTVLLCANGYILASVVHDLVNLGFDTSAVELGGMDDAGPFDLLPLTIAAAHLPSTEMGRRAMRLLAERIDHPNDPVEIQHIVLPIEIRTRESAAGYLRVVGARP